MPSGTATMNADWSYIAGPGSAGNLEVVGVTTQSVGPPRCVTAVPPRSSSGCSGSGWGSAVGQLMADLDTIRGGGRLRTALEDPSVHRSVAQVWATDLSTNRSLVSTS